MCDIKLSSKSSYKAEDLSSWISTVEGGMKMIRSEVMNDDAAMI